MHENSEITIDNWRHSKLFPILAESVKYIRFWIVFQKMNTQNVCYEMSYSWAMQRSVFPSERLFFYFFANVNMGEEVDHFPVGETCEQPKEVNLRSTFDSEYFDWK